MPNVNLTPSQCSLLCSILRYEQQRLDRLMAEVMPEIRDHATSRRQAVGPCLLKMEEALASSRNG